MRRCDRLFDALQPTCVVTSTAEEPCDASKERKLLTGGSEASNVRGRKADKLWVTTEGDGLVWMEAKKGTFAENHHEALHAVLTATKGAKDLMDSIRRHRQKDVETWSSIQLGTHWHLRSQICLESGLIVAGNTFTHLRLPTSYEGMPMLLELCRVVLLWGLALDETARELARPLPIGTPKKKRPVLSTFPTPEKPSSAKR
ncbi:hypothetical protein BC832DRAFT_564636 [Gaertneriomyces semiglobifer]|nr:hypothetical protein BC832DRAFT_564636 [Gaertneriomyces semiglobifer]